MPVVVGTAPTVGYGINAWSSVDRDVNGVDWLGSKPGGLIIQALRSTPASFVKVKNSLGWRLYFARVVFKSALSFNARTVRPLRSFNVYTGGVLAVWCVWM